MSFLNWLSWRANLWRLGIPRLEDLENDWSPQENLLPNLDAQLRWTCNFGPSSSSSHWQTADASAPVALALVRVSAKDAGATPTWHVVFLAAKCHHFNGQIWGYLKFSGKIPESINGPVLTKHFSAASICFVRVFISTNGPMASSKTRKNSSLTTERSLRPLAAADGRMLEVTLNMHWTACESVFPTAKSFFKQKKERNCFGP